LIAIFKGASLDNQGQHRRHDPRYRCSGAVEISQHGKRWGWGRINEISHGGCYIEIEHPLPAGTELQLRFTIADCELEIGAKVASADPTIGMGMEFMAVSEEQEVKLVEILGKVAVDNAPPEVEEHPQPARSTVRITPAAAPAILAKIIKHMNEKGVLTRQELAEIVKSSISV
jgi:hypothetical protein